MINMLEEFIGANNLKAEIISFSTETPVAVILKQKKFVPRTIVQTKLFISAKKDEILTITPFGKEVQIELLEEIIGEDLLESNEEECLKITGYKRGFAPPISIYGVKVIIDPILENLNYIIAPISTKKYLKIPLEEVLSFNEDVSFGALTE